MKRLYLIGGPMGVGKTTVCRELQKRLDRSVFLDGDWCWDANPFQVTEETKAMVTENICFLLNNFLRCSVYNHVVFCWVLHQQAILEAILSRLDTWNCAVRAISLTASPEALTARITADIRAGRREPEALERSLAYLPLYAALSTEKLDVSRLTLEEAAERILEGCP
ncbi:AAA family ATPase [Oscillospiraceae bacterium 38-13]